MTIENHYGIWVGSEQPTTGVLANHEAEWLSDELDSGINLSYEEALAEYNDSPGAYLKYGIENEDNFNEQYEEMGDTYLIGAWNLNPDGQYEPDLDGEYSAIVGETYTQVVRSLYVERGALCSPCYPGQVDLGSEGEFRAFTLPTWLWGDGIEPQRKQVVKAETLAFWLETLSRAISDFLAHDQTARYLKTTIARAERVSGELNK